MRDKFENQYSQEVVEKTKKNLVWIIAFSITMIFAGFTSAYIVSMGDNFWVKVPMPSAFYWSTGAIILSSISLIFSVRALKKKNLQLQKVTILITLVLGLIFGYLQFRGYQQLIDKGAMFNTWIIVDNGRYGDYFEIKKENDKLTVENNQYVWKGEQLEGEHLDALQDFMSQFLMQPYDELSAVEGMENYTLFYKGEPLSLSGDRLVLPSGESLQKLDYKRLQHLSKNIVDNRADFFMSGEMGKDFTLYYKGKPLEYKDRELMYDGQVLSPNLQNKLVRGNKDTATAYMYIITFLHLLHVVAGIIMLLIYTKRSFTAEIMNKGGVALRSGAIFWHFLAGLWLYLLLFLNFIH